MTALSYVQFWARGMEYGSFYECLGKMLLSTEAEDVKAQAELILELELGLQNTHVEQTNFRYAEDRNRTREQGYCSNQILFARFQRLARALAPTPALKTTRRHTPSPPPPPWL